MNNYCDLIRLKYSEIGSNELGYVEDALGYVLKILDELVRDERLPDELKERAAYAAANLLISDLTHP